ncbi:hypothetical protein PMY56_11300 [Clostridium tertium]|jgi:hypothetical protein|uniref:hypothetical protein n=1 Tax=Clostridium TaxID=1485 RepID=UPI0018AC6D5A|nr:MULTISPECIES: hypothetical protein [Clostridium]MDU7966041.1 hypothetical protein [Paeniclostridium sordellii]MBS5307568.1 hypothetical protein [Clostridium sp.]MBS6500569.1 hypothetical protein [Clostridium sp.]MDB1923130.1 hypothetical protein [Clostridium tertium]MDB1926728.1 hypothetical protein [Clostridium tertium]
MKKIIICLLFSIIFMISCAGNNIESTNKVVDNKSSEVSEKNLNNDLKDNSINKNLSDTSQEKETEEISGNESEVENSTSGEIMKNEDISEKVKNYIINGQSNKSEAEKIKWSKTFLNEVDIKSLYDQYISTGGNANDLEKFASYMTLNAPIVNNWEELFKKDLYDIYGEKVVRLKHLENDLYEAYIKKDGAEVPYVVVSARTGYFHG